MNEIKQVVIGAVNNARDDYEGDVISGGLHIIITHTRPSKGYTNQ